MPTGHQSEIRNKAVFPSPPKEGLTEWVETGYPQGNIRERTGKSQCTMHNAERVIVCYPHGIHLTSTRVCNAQCIMYKTRYVNYLFLIVN